MSPDLTKLITTKLITSSETIPKFNGLQEYNYRFSSNKGIPNGGGTLDVTVLKDGKLVIGTSDQKVLITMEQYFRIVNGLLGYGNFTIKTQNDPRRTFLVLTGTNAEVIYEVKVHSFLMNVYLLEWPD